MNEFELPDDIKILERLYQSPEERISELEELLQIQNKHSGLKFKDVIYGLHAVIKKQEKEIEELRNNMYGHNKCLNENY